MILCIFFALHMSWTGWYWRSQYATNINGNRFWKNSNKGLLFLAKGPLQRKKKKTLLSKHSLRSLFFIWSHNFLLIWLRENFQKGFKALHNPAPSFLHGLNSTHTGMSHVEWLSVQPVLSILNMLSTCPLSGRLLVFLQTQPEKNSLSFLLTLCSHTWFFFYHDYSFCYADKKWTVYSYLY